MASADIVVPVAAGSALVQTEGPLTLHRSTIGGPVAVGTHLTFHGPSSINGGSVDVPVATGGTRPLQLHVAGAPQWSDSTGRLSVNGSGGLAIGDLSGTATDDSGADVVLQPAPVVASRPLIRGGFDQSASSVPAADLDVDIAGRFADYRDSSAALGRCQSTVTVVDDVIRLQSGVTNVWTVTEVTLDHTIAQLRFDVAPSPTTKLIVNITGAGGDISLPSGMTDAISPHILWNFVGAGTVQLTGQEDVRGTVYAPGFVVRTRNPRVIEGNVIARSFDVKSRAAGMRVADFGFAGAVECGRAVVVATTPPVTTGTTVPPGTTTAATTSSSTTSTSVPATGSASSDTATDSSSSESSSSGSTSNGSASTAPSGSVSSSATADGSTSGTTGSSTATDETGVSTSPGTATATGSPSTSTRDATSTVSTSDQGDPQLTTSPSTAVTSTPDTSSTVIASVSPATVLTQPPGESVPSTTLASQPPSAPTVTSATVATQPAAVVSSASPTSTSLAVASTVGDPGDAAGITGAADPTGPSAGGTSVAVASASGSTAVAGATTTATRAAIGRIAFTGADVAGLVLTGIGLLAAGIGMTWTTRRQNAAGRHVA